MTPLKEKERDIALFAEICITRSKDTFQSALAELRERGWNIVSTPRESTHRERGVSKVAS